MQEKTHNSLTHGLTMRLYTKIFRNVDFLSLNNTVMPSKPNVFRV